MLVLVRVAVESSAKEGGALWQGQCVGELLCAPYSCALSFERQKGISEPACKVFQYIQAWMACGMLEAGILSGNVIFRLEDVHAPFNVCNPSPADDEVEEEENAVLYDARYW